MRMSASNAAMLKQIPKRRATAHVLTDTRDNELVEIATFSGSEHEQRLCR
jgi:hypothetical protein